MDQAERGQQADARMRPQQSEASVIQALLLEPQRGFDNALVEHQQQLQPLLLLLFHYRRHGRGAQLLLAGFGEQLGAPRQTRLQRQRLQTVLDDGAHLDQLVTVTQHAQNLAALERWSMQPRKLIMDQQLQNQFRVAPIVLLPPARATPNLVCRLLLEKKKTRRDGESLVASVHRLDTEHVAGQDLTRTGC